MLGTGIDFGTSNSSAATFDGDQVVSVRIERTLPHDVMPTALYIDRDRKAAVGREAVETYVSENAGRSVNLVAETVGEIEMTFAGTDQTPPLGTLESGDSGSSIEAVQAYADQDLPGRLFRGVKRWLGNAGLDRVRVFDANYRIVALVTPVLSHLRATASEAGGGRDREIYVGRPVVYEGAGDDANALAVGRMREACGYAGLKAYQLYPEPIAAVASFVARCPSAGDQVVLAFDFGGGTLDLSVVRRAGTGFTVLATHGDGVGGDEINRMLCRERVFPELGDGAHVHVPINAELKRVPFPFGDFAARLLSWTLAYELNQPALCEQMAQGMREKGEAGRRIGRLYRLVKENRAYQLFQAIEDAKLALSERSEASIEVEDLDLCIAVTRCEFETMLAPVLERVDACIESVLAASGVAAEDIEIVVRTGGSSRIPAVIRRLERRFPGRVVEHDPFTSIAAGLAIASYHGYAAPN